MKTMKMLKSMIRFSHHERFAHSCLTSITNCLLEAKVLFEKPFRDSIIQGDW